MARNVKNSSGYHSSGKTIQDKAAKFGIFVKQFGWSGSFKTNEDGNVDLVATRGDNETIQITWYKTGGGEVWYTLAGERQRCHNVSAAAKIAQEKPNYDRFNRVMRKRRKKLAVENGEVTPELTDGLQGSLPFDHESSDDEIKLMLLKRSITWVDSLGRLNTATVNAGKYGDLFKVVRNGHDYIDFVDEYGFHSVYLDRIVSVG